MAMVKANEKWRQRRNVGEMAKMAAMAWRNRQWHGISQQQQRM
jgi:hypothetical protein